MIEQTVYYPWFRGLKDLQRHYRALFAQRNPSTEAVMVDLGKFCCFLSSTQAEKTDDMLIVEGRRQVFLRILEMSKLSTEELFAIYQALGPEQRMALFDSKRPLPPFEDN